jgi:hypothetical protein
LGTLKRFHPLLVIFQRLPAASLNRSLVPIVPGRRVVLISLSGICILREIGSDGSAAIAWTVIRPGTPAHLREVPRTPYRVCISLNHVASMTLALVFEVSNILHELAHFDREPASDDGGVCGGMGITHDFFRPLSIPHVGPLWCSPRDPVAYWAPDETHNLADAADRIVARYRRAAHDARMRVVIALCGAITHADIRASRVRTGRI